LDLPLKEPQASARRTSGIYPSNCWSQTYWSK